MNFIWIMPYAKSTVYQNAFTSRNFSVKMLLHPAFYLKYPDLSARRKRDLKHGATIPVVGADRSLMQVDDLLSQGKANAGFSLFPM